MTKAITIATVPTRRPITVELPHSRLSPPSCIASRNVIIAPRTNAVPLMSSENRRRQIDLCGLSNRAGGWKNRKMQMSVTPPNGRESQKHCSVSRSASLASMSSALTHLHVTSEVKTPPISGPRMAPTPKTAPTPPDQTGTLFNGTEAAMICRRSTQYGRLFMERWSFAQSTFRCSPVTKSVSKVRRRSLTVASPPLHRDRLSLVR